MYENIRYEVADPVAAITLDRPDSMNAWTGKMDSEIRDAMTRAEADPAVVGIIVTGAGRAFCAGADMKGLSNIAGGGADAGLAGESKSPWNTEDGDFAGRFAYLMEIGKPIVAAINGPVAGMAYPFALCCDIRVVSPDALFVTAFAQRGLIAEWGLAWFLPRLVGPGIALDLLFTSRRVNGEEALQLGLANYLVPADQLLDFCRSYIEKLAQSSSPTSMAIMKRQVYEHFHRGLGEAEHDAYKLMVDSLYQSDFKEGVQSFVERRPPNFPRIGS